VVTTVRSDDKGRDLLAVFPNQSFSYVVVKEIGAEGAFDEAVKADPPFDAVIHTASPYHYNVQDNKRDMIDPAVNGTTGILRAIDESAKQVKRVVITSSFAAMSNPTSPPAVYTEEAWNPMTMEESLATTNPQVAYRASKVFAEKAAWDFVKTQKPSFALTVINPPMIYGPLRHPISSLADLNTSNKRILDLMQGVKGAQATAPMYIDVRDLALAHVLAIELPEAAGERFFACTSMATQKDMCDIIRKEFPDIAASLRDDVSDTLPSFRVDNSKIVKALGLQFRSLEDTVVDTVRAIRALGA
jgi:nucleoside-diphosphate-sugar epimerase